ncbi:protein kinase C-binding protein NELL2-like [Paramacrobiotus metropolitanus]|uniref:protein kinase C-binding protein NELL2-like n=1 Tax=Paramacrobiotus metropolitanus TaxID=2943436 RepID=UPI002445CAB1|nr:protein kinase C-binding protein NELL2-like [Paramacrobiotus metropolitanus]
MEKQILISFVSRLAFCLLILIPKAGGQMTKARNYQVIDRRIGQQYPNELDLLPRLVIPNNDSQIARQAYPASVTSGAAMDRNSRAVLLVDGHRQADVTQNSSLAQRLQRLLINSTDMTLLLKLRQNYNNTGALLAMDIDTFRMIELISRGKLSELILLMRNGTNFTAAVIPYRLADNQWHSIAMTLESSRAVLRLNCKVVFECPLASGVFDMIRYRNVSLRIGESNLESVLGKEQFKGALLEAKVRTGPNAYSSQCPREVSANKVQSAPTAAGATEENKLQRRVDRLENTVRLLETKMANYANRVLYLEAQLLGSCQTSTGLIKRDNESWEEKCRNCTCRNGVRDSCPEIPCPDVCPPGEEGKPFESCCPVCQASCNLMGEVFAHGDPISLSKERGACLLCHCVNGRIDNCASNSEICPILPCPEDQQMQEPGKCCKRCRLTKSCGKIARCHENATCVLTPIGPECRCKPGFAGNGSSCEDIDECTMENSGPNSTVNHCRANTVCSNTFGGHHCECLPGYNHTNPWSCQDINECQNGSNLCAGHAKCMNSEGSYSCQCLPGYEGDGFTCTPICEPVCQNGGHCFAPNTCACQGGFFGPECQVDVDECAFNISSCKANSVCVNTPGSYFCECMDGYKAENPYLREPVCQDIDECYSGAHFCPPLTRCQNVKGSWKCLCPVNETCDMTCTENRSPHAPNVYGDRCQNCTCQDAVLQCRPVDCDCKHGERDVLDGCCPGCNVNRNLPLCYDAVTNASYPSGTYWFENCRSCECKLGAVRCTDVKCPLLKCAPEETVTIKDGACCPVCQSTRFPDRCLADLTREPVRFSCEAKRIGMGSFFREWTDILDVCTLCDCRDGSICCTVQNGCRLRRYRLIRIRSS